VEFRLHLITAHPTKVCEACLKNFDSLEALVRHCLVLGHPNDYLARRIRRIIFDPQGRQRVA
jgi:hypothetical protein